MAKGIAIILMVMVHAHFSHYGGTFINMFHMPLFFFMSGYCFKESYLTDLANYLKKRAKVAWWPYVKWGLLFLVLHNVFFTLNVYNGEYGFRGEVSELYTGADFIKRAGLIIFSMNGAEQLLGGYWFLHSYFIAAVISYATIWMFRKNMLSLVMGGGLLALFCVLFLYTEIRIPYYVEGKEMFASAIMVIGFVYKRSQLHFEDSPIYVIPLCLAIVVVGSFYWPCGLLTLTWKTAIPYFFSALAGTMMVFALCKWLSKQSLVNKLLVYVGDRTIDILTWHFLSFKLVSLVIILVSGLSISQLAEFPVLDSYAYKGWWVLYLTVGIVIPLSLDYMFSRIHFNWGGYIIKSIGKRIFF